MVRIGLLVASLALSAPTLGAPMEGEPQAPAAPMAPAMLGGIQRLLRTDAGVKLVALDPSLGALREMNARSPLQLEALGRLGELLKQRPGIARLLRDPARRQIAAAELLRANRDPANADHAAAVLRARARALRRDAGAMSGREKRAAAAQLGALADFADDYKSKSMAKAARDARKAAAALLPRPNGKDAPVIRWLDVLSLRPMQFDVGMQQVEKKKQLLLGMTPARQRQWLLEHPVPVILRKNGDPHVHKKRTPKRGEENRPDDHHHQSRAVWEAGIKRLAIVIEDEREGAKRKRRDKKFWKRMLRDNKVYLYDRFGNGPHDPRDLPLDVRGLGDNPYRSVAGEVRDRGGYKKTRKPFAEFLWAEYFRKNLTVHPNDDFEAAAVEAMALARDRRARRLPGYRGGKRKKS